MTWNDFLTRLPKGPIIAREDSHFEDWKAKILGLDACSNSSKWYITLLKQWRQSQDVVLRRNQWDISVSVENTRDMTNTVLSAHNTAQLNRCKKWGGYVKKDITVWKKMYTKTNFVLTPLFLHAHISNVQMLVFILFYFDCPFICHFMLIC